MRTGFSKKVVVFTALVVLILFVKPGISEEVPYELGWLKQIGSVGINETVYGITHDSHYIYITGRTNGPLPENQFIGSNDIFAAKFGLDGQRLWIKQIGSTSPVAECGSSNSLNESSYAVAVDAAGNSYIAGRTEGSLGSRIAGKFDIFLIKFDPYGAELWRKQIGTSNQDEAYGLALDNTGSFVFVVGDTTGSMTPFFNAGGSDLLILKYTADGSLVGKLQMGTTADDEIRAVAFSGDGGSGRLLITGSTKGILQGANSGGKDHFVADVAADLASVRQFVQGGTQQHDEATSLALDQAGNIYIAGYISTPVTGFDPATERTTTVSSRDKKGFIKKYAQNETLTWSEEWTRVREITAFENVDKLADNNGAGLAVDYRNNIYLTDYLSVQDPVTGTAMQKDIHVLKYSPEGVLLWQKQLGTPLDERGFAVTTDSNGAVYVAGYTTGSLDPVVANAGGADLFVLQITDQESPSGSISINDGEAYTNSTAIALRVSCDDRTGSGCSQMRFSNSETGLEGEAWQPFADRLSWTMQNGDGNKTVFGQFKDRAGNISAVATAVTTLDTALPRGILSINGGAAATNSTSVTLEPSCDDNGSGCAFVRFSNDTAAWPEVWESFSAESSWPWTVPSGDGSKTVFVQFMDKAGNITAENGAILLDMTPPAGSIVINAAAEYSNTKTVELALSCNDSAGSGCGQMRIRNDGTTWAEESWEAFAQNRNAWVLTGEDGSKTVYAQFKDAAGNTSVVSSDAIQLDTAGPSAFLTINAGALNTANSSVALSLACSDGSGSGCGQMRLSNDGTNWPGTWEASASNRNDWPLTGGDGGKTVYVQFRDNAGNISSAANDSILLDTTAPTGSLSIFSGTSNAEVTNLAVPSLVLTCGDGNGSGCAYMSFSNDGSIWSSWEVFSSNARWALTDGSGAKTVFARLRDNAGNAGLVSDSISLDTTLKPDMAVTLTAPATGGRGENITVSDTTKNNGAGAAESSTTDFYLSKDAVLDETDVLLGRRSVALLPAGAIEAGSTALLIPAATEGGTLYIIAKADGGNVLGESSETNNANARSIKIGPDLVVSALTVPSTSGAGKSITITDTTKNSGAAPSGTSITSFYLSPDSVLDANDVFLGSRSVDSLLPGATQAGSSVLIIPSNAATGTYYIIGQADADNSVSELYENNNTQVKSIKIGPDMAVTVLGIPSTAGSGKAITVTDTTKNSGPGDAAGSVTRMHFSKDNKLDSEDTLLGERSVPALLAGTTSSGSTSVIIPAGLPAGTYYIIAMADAENAVTERIETNITYKSILVGTDMTVSSLSAPAASGCGKSVSLSLNTKNAGPGDAAASTTRLYLSTDNDLDDGDIHLGDSPVPALPAATTDSGSATVIIPGGLAAGTYYFLAEADTANTVSELNETNNVTSRSIQVGPEVTVTSISAPSTAGSGKSITVTDTTKNSGAGDAEASLTRFYFSSDNQRDSTDLPLGERAVPALAPGTSSSATTQLTVPGGLQAGIYYILGESDANNTVDELNESNNMLARSIQVGTDMTISSISAPSTTGSGKSIVLTSSTKNSGPGDAAASTTRWYFSADDVLDSADIVLGDISVPFLAPSSSNSGSLTITIPAVSSAGTYYILAQADALNTVSELNETNNATARSIKVGPDMQVTSMTVPSTAGSGKTIAVSDTTKNSGAGDAGASVTKFYFSADNNLDSGDIGLAERSVSALAAGVGSSGSTTMMIPPGLPSGTYYLIAQADSSEVVSELSESNNITVRSLQLGPDLQCSNLNAPSSSGAGNTIAITEITKNNGPGDAAASQTNYYLSLDNAVSEDDLPLGSRNVEALAADVNSSATSQVILPLNIAPGSYYLIAKADSADAVGEINENNNITYRTIIVGPDLQIASLTVPTSATAGDVVNVADTTKNAGAGDAASSVTAFYLSTDNVLSAEDLMLASRNIPALAAGTSSNSTTSVAIPSDVLPGAYYILAHTNDGGTPIAETNEANNVLSRPIGISQQ